MQESTSEYQARKRGAPTGNRNALKTGRHTAEMKDFRRRLRAFRRRADLAVAATNRSSRAESDEARAEAYAALVAAASASLPVITATFAAAGGRG